MKTIRKYISLLTLGCMMFDLAACAHKIDEDEFNDSVLDTAEEICEALLRLDYDSVNELSSKENKTLSSAMPLDENFESEDAMEKYAFGAVQAVASTLDYEIDDDIDSDPENGTAEVDVTFTYKDYSEIQDQIDYIDDNEFKRALEDSDDVKKVEITLEFERDEDDEIKLTNSKELNRIFEYDDLEVTFLEDLFDLLDESNYVGPCYDEVSDTLINPTSIDISMTVGERGQHINWQYKYKVCKDWEQLYLSDWITADYPEQIDISYASPDGSVLEPGYYQVIVYQEHDDYILMFEIEVVNN